MPAVSSAGKNLSGYIIMIIKIHTQNEYEIILQRGISQYVPQILSERFGKVKYAVITDSKVSGLYGNHLCSALSEAGLCACQYYFKDGESSKNVTTALDIISFLSANGFTRSDVIIALGGGVPGDTAGFAASIYMRGIKYVQIPTTLLAMIDSSVGGKTAVDTEYGKNLIGTFFQPSLVICDPYYLKTLPEDVFLCGVGELLKYSVLCGAPSLEKLSSGIEKNDPDLDDIIASCIRYKAETVSKDENDSNGQRNVLNLGHTFGHAIEKLSDYSIPHGFAVATGLCMICRVSSYLGFMPYKLTEKIERVAEKLGFATKYTSDPDLLIKAMNSDKKRRGDGITFVLPKEGGEFVTLAISEAETRSIIEKTLL